MGPLSLPGPTSGRAPRSLRAVSRHSTPRAASVVPAWPHSLLAASAETEPARPPGASREPV
jgi:hypothetical protein